MVQRAVAAQSAVAALRKSMAAKRARHEGVTKDRAMCGYCGYFYCTCRVALANGLSGVRRKRFILDQLAALSADMSKATNELVTAVEEAPCVCTRPKHLCLCVDMGTTPTG